MAQATWKSADQGSWEIQPPYFGLGTSTQNAQFLFPSGENYSVDSFTLGMDYYLPNQPLSPLFDAFICSNIQSVVTPEPATFGLLTCALDGLSAIRKKRPIR